MSRGPWIGRHVVLAVVLMTALSALASLATLTLTLWSVSR